MAEVPVRNRLDRFEQVVLAADRRIEDTPGWRFSCGKSRQVPQRASVPFRAFTLRSANDPPNGHR